MSKNSAAHLQGSLDSLEIQVTGSLSHLAHPVGDEGSQNEFQLFGLQATPTSDFFKLAVQ